MKYKGKVLELFVEWKKNIEKSTRRKIKAPRLDNGGEYKSDSFLKVCRDEGIEKHFTIRETPQQNVGAKRMNKTLLEKVRCMLSNAELSKNFWAEPLAYACYLINKLPSSAIGSKSLLKVWSEKAAQNYNSLKVFGCPAYYYVKEDKLDPRAKKGVFVRFKKGVKGNKIWDPKDKKFILSRDVTFDEVSMLKLQYLHR